MAKSSPSFFAPGFVLAGCFLFLFLIPSPADAFRFPWQKGREIAPADREVPFVSEPTDEESILRAQIFLDRNNFGPGKVDGQMGEFTQKAVSLYNMSIGREDTDNWFFVIEGAEAIGSSLVAFQVGAGVERYIERDLPQAYADQKDIEYLGYRSIAEFVAERFHTDANYLAKVNPGLNMGSLKPGSVVAVPNVDPYLIETVETHSSFEADPLISQYRVLIDTDERVSLFYDEAGRLQAAFPITPGQPKFIPIGHWEIVIMITTPEFRYDKKMLEEGVRSEDGSAFMLSPGPNSPVGMLWAGLDKSGIGLHGTASPRTIGRSRSAGCVRFANWDVYRLPGLIRPGSKVEVR